MIAVMILLLIVHLLTLFFLMIGVGHLGNIAVALGHIAQIWTAPTEVGDEERGRH